MSRLSPLLPTLRPIAVLEQLTGLENLLAHWLMHYHEGDAGAGGGDRGVGPGVARRAQSEGRHLPPWPEAPRTASSRVFTAAS